MELILRLEEFQRPNLEEDWLYENDDLRTLLSLVESHFPGRVRSFHRNKDETEISLAAWSALHPEMHRAGLDTYCVTADALASPGPYFQLEEYGFGVIAPVRCDTLEEVRAAIDWMVRFSVEAYRAFQPRFRVGYRLGVEVFDVPGLEARPTEFNGYWESGKAVDFLSRSFHSAVDWGRPEDFATLATQPLPPRAARRIEGDFLVVSWAEAAKTIAEFADAVAARDAWLAANAAPDD